MKYIQSKLKRSRANTVRLNRDDLRLAEQSVTIFKRYTDRQGRLSFQINKKESVVIPAVAARLFEEILIQLSEGNVASILPIQKELTTQQAAELLNVSRPYLISLVDQGKIPYRKVGTHRRIYAKDILAFKKNDEQQRSSALDELVREAQKLNIGY